jgi:hypothetical protein
VLVGWLVGREVLAAMESNPETYVCFASGTLWGIHLLLFARPHIAEDISGLQVRRVPGVVCCVALLSPCVCSCVLWGVRQVSTEATGIGGVMGNKGGVAVGFTYKETTRMAFVGAHLAARATRYCVGIVANEFRESDVS